MPRTMVGLLAAEAAAMATLASLAHGFLFWIVVGVIFAVAGLVGYATAPDRPAVIMPSQAEILPKKLSRPNYNLISTRGSRVQVGPGLWPGPRRQARWAGRGSRVKVCPKGRDPKPRS